MHRIVVLFPDPLGPRKPVTRPGLTSKLRSLTATVRPNRLVSPLTSIIPGTLVPTIERTVLGDTDVMCRR